MVRQDYDQLADAYEHNRKLHPMVLERLIALGGLDAASRVLEIGCGTGNYIHAIASSTPAVCTGVEPSSEMLRIARSNHGLPKQRRDSHEAKVAFIQGSAEELPVPDQQFGLVFSVDVIHHVQERAMAAREALRVTKAGGVFVIVTESEDDVRHRTPQVTYFPETIEVELGRYPSIEVIERELTDAGFDVDQEISVSMPHEVLDLQPYRDKAYSSLHLISDDAFAAGLTRMETDIRSGPIRGNRRYTMVVARRPA